MNALIDLDKRIFLSLNDLHASWLDPLMMWFSGNVIWLPLYIFLLFQLSKLPRVHMILALLGIVVCITLADQLSSSMLKPLVSRPRPTWDPGIGSLVHTVNDYRGGRFGFPSSHAANTFAVATLLNLILRTSWIRWLFLWAGVVSYSRIYLGVHYPGDVMVGALLGVVCGWISYQLYKSACASVDKGKNEVEQSE